MEEIFIRIWHNLVERTEGPMHFRFFMQPLMALIFTIRAAIRDVKAGTKPYLERLIGSSKGQRRTIAKETWKDVGKIFIVGIILDIIYQLIVIYGLKTKERFYPLESIIVAFALAIIPYVILRGPINRIITLFTGKKKSQETNNEL